ncbi:hypothetical protein B9Z55_009407 [Caenorhabditis nigoni]|uniref:MARVEL domain-containing protein n=2 Tax=Caenorhabditis nigoni TaxID=1611254 RepID=A0A2G5USC5_9PELO|nr:hypothetical protein B9Z55_009407 [Caenorhabditis nigoni]
MTENQYHPAVNHMFSPRGRARTGGDFAADPDSSCICMPIKFWFIMLALIHLCLVIISLSVKFYYIFETIIVVLSLFIICLPDIFAVFVHYLIQLIFWFVTAIIYLVVLIKEAEKEADAGRITLFLLYITLCLTYAIIYFRLVVAGR